MSTTVAGDANSPAERCTRSDERNGVLDGVRALAVIMVVLSHSATRNAFPRGAVGVDIFFVLSGFLITGLLVREHDREGSFSLRRFYARRALRIWPAFYAYLVVVLVWALFFTDHVRRRATLTSLGWVATFTSNLKDATGHEVFYALGQTWSLGVEEQFYVVWPCLLVVLFALLRNRRRIAVATAFLALCSASALWLSERHGVNPQRLFFGPDIRAEELLAGALGGMWLAWGHPRIRPRIGAVVALCWGVLVVSVATAAWPGSRTYYRVQPLLAVGTMALLLVATCSTPPRLLTGTLGAWPVRWVGRISYSIYLWYVPVVLYMERWRITGNGSRNIAVTLLEIVFSMLLAAASYYFVEQPFLHLKDRHFRNRANEGQLLANAPTEAS